MLAQSTIDAVKSKASLEEIVNMYATVKSHTACCPFHGEKTPSFHIYHDERYKCFGCGVSGDVITFVQEKEGKPFDEAVQWLAEHYNLPVDYDKIKEVSPETKDKLQKSNELVQWAYKEYQKAFEQLPDDAAAVQYLAQRGISRMEAIGRGYGYAPDNYKFLTTSIINMGAYEIGKEIGLLRTKDGNSNDFYRHRIIIPLINHRGALVGLSARHIPSEKDDPRNKPIKYFNPKDSIIYNKKKMLYGLYSAMRAIRQKGFVYLTEGYFDVDTMHAHDIKNAVASCGTEFDDEQIKFLKRYTQHVVLCYDGDEAGQTKMEKLVDRFLLEDFKVEVITFPDKQDPDEYIRNYQPVEIADEIFEESTDDDE